MRLLHLPMQAYRCDEVFIEQLDRFRTDVIRERVVCMLHVSKAKEGAEIVNPAIEAGEITLNPTEGIICSRAASGPRPQNLLVALLATSFRHASAKNCSCEA